MNQLIEKSITINSSPHKVWSYLTKPELMIKWAGEPDMSLEILTNWEVGSDFIIKGFHNTKFENKGVVMQFDPYRILQYSHLSSVSRLPDTIENYSIITFLLTPKNAQTILSFRIENFPTEIILKHLDFYWDGTLSIIKQIVEQG